MATSTTQRRFFREKDCLAQTVDHSVVTKPRARYSVRRSQKKLTTWKRCMSNDKRYYIIDFVYADTKQQFSTGADLNENELSQLLTYLNGLEIDGIIYDAQVR